jgi:hypothetical protein
MSGTSAPMSYHERNANCAVDRSRYTGVTTSAIAALTTNAIETARNRVPLTRRTSGRAMPIRSANSPIAAMTERNVSQRATMRRGVAAVSEIDGIANCGAGPGFGPSAKVNAPRTGCPSAEMTRQ